MGDDFYVYTWTRPDTGEVFYVGKGRGDRDVKMQSRNRHFINVVEKLIRCGLVPVVDRVAEGLSEKASFDLERAEIAKHGRRDLGTGSLVNKTDGGEGVSGLVWCMDSRARLSASKKGKTISAEHRARIVAGLVGRTLSMETKAKISASHVGIKPTKESREKMSIAKKGTTHTLAARARMSAATRGRTHTPETRAKISAAQIGKIVTAETRNKISAARTGIARTPEAVAKTSAANRMRRSLGLYKGVGKKRDKWEARIYPGGKRKNLGVFPTAIEAARAYDAAATAAFGIGNCYLNFPPAANDNEPVQASVAA